MTGAPYVRWREEGWRGWLELAAESEMAACIAAAGGEPGRRSRHARTVRLVTRGGVLFVKFYPAPGGWRAIRAFRMGRALARAGFSTPAIVAAGRREGAGLLVTRGAEGEELAVAVARQRHALGRKRKLLREIGTVVGRLHAAGFVHGDLVPSNVLVAARGPVFLDNDRTRRSRFLVWFAGRRNLVQLGRFVVPGLTLTDRARVLGAYARARRLSQRRRRRLARWLVGKTMARRCAIDHVPPELAARVGFRELMRSGGPCDPTRAAAGVDAPAGGAAGRT